CTKRVLWLYHSSFSKPLATSTADSVGAGNVLSSRQRQCARWIEVFSVLGRRPRALLVALLAIVGLAWCVSRLRALGAPFLPAFLTGIVPPTLHAAIGQLAAEAGALALQLGALL